MVPFTSTSPAPACERRRLRLVNKFLFSVLDRGDPFGDERGGDAGDASDNDGLGEFGSRRTDFHSRTKRRGENAPSPPDFEVRLYAVLGALLEVSCKTCRVVALSNAVESGTCGAQQRY